MLECTAHYVVTTLGYGNTPHMKKMRFCTDLEGVKRCIKDYYESESDHYKSYTTYESFLKQGQSKYGATFRIWEVTPEKPWKMVRFTMSQLRIK